MYNFYTNDVPVRLLHCMVTVLYKQRTVPVRLLGTAITTLSTVHSPVYSLHCTIRCTVTALLSTTKSIIHCTLSTVTVCCPLSLYTVLTVHCTVHCQHCQILLQYIVMDYKGDVDPEGKERELMSNFSNSW